MSTTALYDSSLVPGIRQRSARKKRWWQFWRSAEPARRMRPKLESDRVEELPPWRRTTIPGLSVLPEGRVPAKPRFGDYIEKPPPVPKLDPVEEAKLQLRRMTWIQFTEAAEAMGCKPNDMWKWATA
jgi:hypothetical protein